MQAITDSSIESQAQETTARGPMRRYRPLGIVFGGRVLVSIGTASAPEITLIDRVIAASTETNGGIRPASNASTLTSSSAIMEVRRLSGLTWEQLARLFGVARRSLHFWASGASLSSINEERLQRVLGLLRLIDRGDARSNRSALLQAQKDGVIPLDLLSQGKYSRVFEYLSEGLGRRKVGEVPSSRTQRAIRRPIDLVDMVQDEAVVRDGGARVAKSVHRIRKAE